jgi:hypothetical protein
MFHMSPINPKAGCGIWCALLLCASGENRVPNSGDRLEAEMAVRLREMSMREIQPDPHRDVTPELKAIKKSQIENLTAEDLAKMTLDNPLLKYCYALVFGSSLALGAFNQLDPQQELVLADIRRRGETVSPMLLKLIEENRETWIEWSILGKIEYLKTVRIDPFLEYSRRLLRERTRSDVVGVAAVVLARHGTKEDIELFEWLLTQQPFAVTDVTNNLKILRDRLDALPSAPRPERREIPLSNSGNDASRKGSEKYLQEESSSISQLKPWIVGGFLLVGLIGLYRFLRQKQ